MGFIGLGLGLGVFRLADYQVVEADKLRERADARRLLAQTLYAKRGTIYDRNGNVLASSVECRNIAVNPQLVEDVDKTVSALVKATGIDKKTCRKLVESDGTWVYIKRQVDEDDAATLEKKNLPGVLFEQAMKRVYPYGNLASQVLGVVNVDNDGLTGLEKQYNKLLTGTNGSLVRERARDGSYIAGGAYKKVAAVDGVDIVTTLDVNIQRAAEDALAEAVEKTKAKNGSALVTDPTTGEILAACSYPTYDQTNLENAKTEDMNLRLVTDATSPARSLRRSWRAPASTWASCDRVRRLRCRRASRWATIPSPMRQARLRHDHGCARDDAPFVQRGLCPGGAQDRCR